MSNVMVSPLHKMILRLGLTLALGSAAALLPATAQATPGALTQLASPNSCIEWTGDGGSECPNQTALGLESPQRMVVSPDGKNAYAVSHDNSSLEEFSRDPSTGALTELPGANACIAEDAQYAGCPTNGVGLHYAEAIAISPDGKNVYVAGEEGSSQWYGAIAEFSRDPNTGALTQLTGLDTCVEEVGGEGCGTIDGRGIDKPYDLTVSPDGKNVYVADGGGSGGQDGAVAEFARDPITGALTQLPPPNACIQEHLSTSSDCSQTGDGLFVVNRVLVSPDGRNVYTALDNSPGAIAEFSRDATTGALTQLPSPNDCIQSSGGSASQGAGDCPQTGLGIDDVYGLDISPDGQNLYSASLTASGPVAEFTRNSDGSLTQLPSPNNCIENASGIGQVGCGTQGVGLRYLYDLKVSPDGQNVYVTSATSSGDVAELARGSNGALTQLASPNNCLQEHGGTGCGTTSAVGLSNPLGLALSPDGTNLYATAAALDGPPDDIAEFARVVPPPASPPAASPPQSSPPQSSSPPTPAMPAKATTKKTQKRHHKKHRARKAVKPRRVSRRRATPRFTG
jgi:DNA-binding beta-propeller fold protein YncE